MVSPRVHQYLDGDLSADALTQEELASAQQLLATSGIVQASFSEQPVPDLVTRVMSHLPLVAPERVSILDRCRLAMKHALDWMVAPLSLTVRPAYALAGATVLLVAGSSFWPQINTTLSPVSVPEGASQVYVQFQLNAPEANSVHLAGSFTSWKPEVEMQEISSGVWTVRVPLSSGVHDYAFVVDGEVWVSDPYAPAVSDGFGGVNSRLSLLTTSSSGDEIADL